MNSDDASAGLVVGVVLAGGEGRRLGGNKPLCELAGTPLLLHAIAPFVRAGLPVVVAAKPSSGLREALAGAVRVVEEPEHPRHPLAGVAQALATLDAEAIVVSACDMPFVPPRLIGWLASRAGVAAVEEDGSLRPFPARWPRSALGAVLRALRAGSSVRQTLARLACERLVVRRSHGCELGDRVPRVRTSSAPQPHPLADIDTFADLLRAAQSLCAGRTTPPPKSLASRA